MNKDIIDPIDDKDEINDDDMMDDSMLEGDFSDIGPMEDIVIEIEEDSIEDFDIVVDEEVKLDEVEVTEDEDLVLSKHKIQGKHSLKYDSIFKGKKEDPLTDEEFESTPSYNDSFEVDKGSIYWFESIDNERYTKDKRIKEKIYEVLLENTDLNFMNNRRKPSKSDFNKYYFTIKTKLKDENFTNTEIFNELSVYFSDNLANMFKLLDGVWRDMIITELREHVGKYNTSPEVSKRNLNIGAEVAFEWTDDLSPEIKIITGVLLEVDEDIYIVDSMERVYNLELNQIIKILNNNKFKYNLNKLDHTDFL